MKAAVPVIMLVEDDPIDAKLTQRALTKVPLKGAVVRLENGDEVIDYLEGSGPYGDRGSHPLPSLVLMDIKLPRRSGLEVVEWIRSRKDEVALLPIVMLTSSRQPADVKRAYELGANSYLTKPDTSSELADMMKATHEYWLRFNERPLSAKQDGMD